MATSVHSILCDCNECFMRCNCINTPVPMNGIVNVFNWEDGTFTPTETNISNMHCLDCKIYRRERFLEKFGYPLVCSLRRIRTRIALKNPCSEATET